ncbi:MAG: anti-sigma F factor antagonist [Desulfotomaculales bacterium]
MDLELDYKDGVLFVRPNGEVDIGVSDELRKVLEDNLEKKLVSHLVFNLSKVSFIDSSGLGVILGRYKKIRQQGGRVSLVAPQPQVRRILALSGLLTILKEYSSEEEAASAGGVRGKGDA